MLAKKLLCFLIVHVPIIYACSQSINSSSLKNEISDLSIKIFSEATTSLKLDCRPTITLTNEDQSSSMPSYGIRISEPVMASVYKSYSKLDAENILLFILCHEYGHQLQFKVYGNDLINLSSCEKRRLYETQADVLAGYFFSRIKKMSDRPLTDDNVQKDLTVFENIYKLGESEYILGTHPSSKQRRNAFRLGIGFDLASSPIYSTNRKHAYEAFNIEGGETFMTWSLKIAKEITHYPLSALKEVQLFRSYSPAGNGFYFDDRSSHPFVIYNDTIVNNSMKAIRFFVQYKVKGVDRKSLDESKAEKNGDTRNYNIIIQPGGKKIISDSITWQGMASQDFMPKIMIMPDNDVLYNAEYIDSNANTQYDDRCGDQDSIAFYASPMQSEQALGRSLEYIARQAYNNFSSIMLGPAILHDRLSIEYKSTEDVAGAEDAMILVGQGRYSSTTLDIIFYKGTDEQQADITFKQLDNELTVLNGQGKIEYDFPFDGEFKDNTSENKYVKTEYGTQYYAVGSHTSKQVYPKDEYSEYSDQLYLIDGKFTWYKCSFNLSYSKKKRFGTYYISLGMKKIK